MIAAFRVRFTNTPQNAMWSDAAFARWLNPAYPFSLANFWYQSSFTLADLNFQIFPPITMDDPRDVLSAADRSTNEIVRPTLVNGVTARATDQFDIDWSNIHGLLIWFAQRTDLFGGGAFPVPLPQEDGGPLEFIFGKPSRKYKTLPVCLSDTESSFDSVCQELGHAYGFEHPLDAFRQEYGDPYDSMASQWYGGHVSPGFLRPADATLPIGTIDANGVDPQRIIGPYASAAHLTISPFAATLRSRGMFVDVPASYATGAASFTLHALDDAIQRFPAQPMPIVAVIPPVTAGGETYFLELRRARGYDAGLRTHAADTNRPPIGVVIHLYDASRKRIVFVDSFSLEDNRGDRDYHLFSGAGFTFRVTSIGADFKTVGITLGGRALWRNFGLTLEDPQLVGPYSSTQSPWQQVQVSPCLAFPVEAYWYHYEYERHTYELAATSNGYEQPGYVWTINGTVLDPKKSAELITVSLETLAPTGTTVASKAIMMTYDVQPDRLVIGCEPEVGNFSVYVEARVVETSPEVVKNFYEDRTSVTSLRFKNVTLRWDASYYDHIRRCAEDIDRVNEKHIPQPKFGPPGPVETFGIVNELSAFGERALRTSAIVGEAVAVEVERLGTVVERAFSNLR